MTRAQRPTGSAALVLLAALLLAPVAARAADAPPALIVVIDDKPVPLAVSKAILSARVVGFLAETTLTLTFRNSTDRVLEGTLFVPLPDESTVSGFGLDVKGEMADGVIVEREKARVVFEKEVRKGVDPGLVEWTKGNVYKTRIYPIPAKGTRAVELRFIHPVLQRGKELVYSLPLNFQDPIEEFGLKVVVVKAAAEPLPGPGAPGGFAFSKAGNDFAADVKLEKAVPPKEVSVLLPGLGRRNVWVEKDDAGETWFAIRHEVQPVPATFKREEPTKRIAILWDASSSRAGADRDRELRILARHLEGKKVPLDLVVFRDAAEKTVSFTAENGGAAALIERLKTVVYDGGTNLSAIVPDAAAPAPDYYLLFSDGLSTLGPEPKIFALPVPGPEGSDGKKAEPAGPGFKAPVYAATSGSSANRAFLRFLAARTAGDFLDLGGMSDEEAVAALGGLSLTLQPPTFDPKAFADLYPTAARLRPGPFTMCGRLTADEGVVHLNYGLREENVAEVGYKVKKADAAEGSLVRTYWAERKAEELSVYPEENEQELIALGKKYGIVTPGTSLLVLETVDQYLEHGIVPPKAREEIYQEWEAKVEAYKADRAKAEEGKIVHVLELWKKRVEWWEKEFKYPEGFRYKEDEKNKRPEAPGEIFSPALGDRLRVSDPAAPAPPPGAQANGGRSPDAAKANGGSGSSSDARIELKEWDPKTPYLEALKAAAPDKALEVYLEQKKTFGGSPAFFLDCSDFFLKAGRRPEAVRILTNVAELELESAPLLRVLAHRLDQIGELERSAALFDHVLFLRPEEPQSYRDLALVLAKMKKYDRALDLLARVVMEKWDRFDEIETIALMEFNRLVPFAKAAGVAKLPLDPRLVKLLDADVRIVLTWDADATDIDLWVVEPSGEKAFYGHPDTTIGGHVSRDFTRGYGPEEYAVRKAMPGPYKVQCNFYGSTQQAVTGPVTIQATVFTNYGRQGEKMESLTVRLSERKEVVDLGEITR